MSELDKIKQDIHNFNARIKSWNLDELSEDESDEVSMILEETMALLAGESLEDEEDFENEDF